MSDNYTMSNVPKDNPEFKDLYLFHGKSAYQAAVEQGFIGTEEEWILSLKDIVFGNISTFNENSDKHIYVDINSNYIYRYDKSSGKYQPIGGVLGETADTAYRGDRGKIAYDHSQSEHVALDHHHVPDEIDGLMDFINKSIIGEGTAPTNLNTIAKIAASLNDDANFASTVANNIATALASAKTYADTVSASALSSAKTYSNTNLASAKTYADQAEADALSAAKTYADGIKTALLGGAPTSLNTLDKLAAAIGDDANFASTITTSISNNLASAKSYADTVSASALSSAKTYTNNTVANYLPLAGGKKITGSVSFGDIRLYPETNNTGTIGSSSNKWYAMYATTFYGALSGNASTASSTPFLTQDNTLTYGRGGLQYFNESMTAGSTANKNMSPTSDWWHIIRMNHPNTNGYYVDLGFCFHGNNAQYRRIASGVSYGWVQLLDSGNYSSYTVPKTGGEFTGNVSVTGTVTASKVYNAVWNDYAEWFERSNINEEIKPGDICTWNGNGITKSNEGDINIIGVFSDSYGHILGGEILQDMDDNIKKYVPIGLAGRVKVKVVGKIKPGDYIIPSKIPGVGKAFTKKKYQFWKKLDMRCVVGKALKDKNTTGIERVEVLIMNT